MDVLNCIIIEDQIPAQKTLEAYILQVPNLKLVDTYISPIEALTILDNGSIDILFLDIHLPKISGIELLKLLHRPPLIILTTAFSEYAVQGFELDVVDYLLKPFSFERFLKSISKIQRIANYHKPIFHQQYLFVRNKHLIQKIAIDEIQYIEAKGDFVLLFDQTKSQIANTSLQEILQKLGNRFVRCHKSYIINLSAIEKITGNRIIIDNKQIPIGRTYKEELLSKIEMI